MNNSTGNMSKPNLLIFNQHASYITIDIANAFARSGKYEKIVLMAGVVNVREDKLDNRIKVVKTIGYIKKSTLTRFYSWIVCFVHFLLLITFRYRSYKLFLVSNPPLISFLPWLCSNKYSALIFDIYPDALASGGFLSENSFICQIWRKANRRFFKKAQSVFTISDGMKTRLAKYCDASKIKVVSLWSSFPPEFIPKEENRFIKANNLEGRFIVMYSGNMGKGIGLDIVVNVAQKLQHEKEILFLFIGDGYAKPELEKMVEKLGVDNFRFMPYQDAAVLKHSLSAADLSIVALPPSTSSISIPNKTFTLIALGRPFLCITSKESDLSQLVKSKGFGESFNGVEVDDMVAFILKTKNDQAFRDTLVQNATNCSGLFTRQNANIFIV